MSRHGTEGFRAAKLPRGTLSWWIHVIAPCPSPRSAYHQERTYRKLWLWVITKYGCKFLDSITWTRLVAALLMGQATHVRGQGVRGQGVRGKSVILSSLL